MKKYEILKTIVGSQAHGLATEDSDVDYRGVYISPTSEILPLGAKVKGSHWMEGETEDNTAYEIGHFLHLATHCNPSILEVFKAPIATLPLVTTEDYINNARQVNWGMRLRGLFPYIWNPQGVYKAFVGYGLTQRKKMLDDEDGRWTKFATAYLRTLHNLKDLLSTGTFSLEVVDPIFKAKLLNIRAGLWTEGQVIDEAIKMKREAKKLLETANNKPDFDRVNDFLLTIRREFWQ